MLFLNAMISRHTTPHSSECNEGADERPRSAKRWPITNLGDKTSCRPWFSLVTRYCCLVETIQRLPGERALDETQPRKATFAVAMREEQKAKIPRYMLRWVVCEWNQTNTTNRWNTRSHGMGGELGKLCGQKNKR